MVMAQNVHDREDNKHEVIKDFNMPNQIICTTELLKNMLESSMNDVYSFYIILEKNGEALGYFQKESGGRLSVVLL